MSDTLARPDSETRSDFRGDRPQNKEFELRGLNHLALVCRDMARTVEFYQGILGMPLIKTLELPGGGGQHFFFDIGNGDSLAFFWFPGAPEPIEGVVTAKSLPGAGDFVTAMGGMNHVAFDVPAELFDEYREKLIAKGIEVSPIMNHDNSVTTVSKDLHPGVFVRSMYFRDPDGVLLELAAWTRHLEAEEATLPPANEAGERVAKG